MLNYIQKCINHNLFEKKKAGFYLLLFCYNILLAVRKHLAL